MLAMEGLRGLAILLVFVCHFQIVVAAKIAPAFDSTSARLITQIGGTGVDLFFLLSGFLIYRTALRPDLQIGAFLVRRVQRIYPTFLVVFAAYLALASRVAGGRIPSSPVATTEYVLLNVLLLPGVVDVPALLSAAWSLSYEISFYLLLPITVRALRLTTWPWRWRCVLFAGAAAGHLLLAYTRPEIFPAYRHYDGAFVRSVMFVSGMILYELLASGRAGWRSPRWLQAGLVVGGAAAFSRFVALEDRTIGTVLHESIPHNALRAAYLFCVYTCLALTALSPDGLLRRPFCGVVLRWTGNVSYSFYLIHGLVLNAIAVVALRLPWVRAHPFLSAGVLLPTALAATAGVAYALYVTVEYPLSLRPQELRSARPRPAVRNEPGLLRPADGVVT
jgi:peptidoglycan/LPS O-acetylase OafA/YrhL